MRGGGGVLLLLLLATAAAACCYMRYCCYMCAHLGAVDVGVQSVLVAMGS